MREVRKMEREMERKRATKSRSFSFGANFVIFIVRSDTHVLQLEDVGLHVGNLGR